jgi:hypothetical protein
MLSQVFGQTTIKKSSIDNGGGLSSAGVYTLIASIGEVAQEERSNGTISVSEGFIDSQILSTLKIEDFKPLHNVDIYPNPTQNVLNLKFDINRSVKIKMYDQLGKEVYHQNFSSNLNLEINLGGLSKGLYILYLVDDENQQFKTYKIVKK